MIELDKRIISGKKPLTCFDAEQARNFVGKKCYLTNDISLFSDLNAFKDIKGCNEAIYEGVADMVTNINTEVSLVFETTYLRWKFCIPCEWVTEKEEPRYRPYTKGEFLNKFKCGEPINIRHKDDHINVFIETIPSVRIDNYMDDVHIRLYEGVVDLQKLFDEFEWQKSNGDWQPFGILKE